MKKTIFFIIVISLVISSASVAYAKPGKGNDQKGKRQQTIQQDNSQTYTMIQNKGSKLQDKGDNKKQNIQNDTNSKKKDKSNKGKAYGKKQSFKFEGSPVIKYGKYKIPIRPITKGMGAAYTFDKTKGILTITKDTTTIVINFHDKTVTVNGVLDTTSNIFTAKPDKAKQVLRYIGDRLGVRITFSKDKITTEVPEEASNITITPVGTNVVNNTLNASTQYMTVTANIKAGKATGGTAELYVGSVKVVTSGAIAATDTQISFTTSDGTPTNEELQALIPAGGTVCVKIYDANGVLVKTVSSAKPLIVDYAVPTITGVTSAVYSVSGSAITLNVTGAGAVNDKVDVTKISLTDTSLNQTYQLTDSIGIISSDSIITINLSQADALRLTGFTAGNTTALLNIAAGAFVTDTAGNASSEFAAAQAVPLTITQ